MKGIADTGFLVALLRRADKHHTWAAELSEGIDEPLLTCDAVLAETAYHLRSSALVIEMVETELIRPAFESAKHVGRLAELALQFQDRRPDFADLCLIRMSELNPKHAILTVDRGDFTVYRRNKREPLPLLLPPLPRAVR